MTAAVLPEPSASPASSGRGHPRGLPVLISLKVWELFSYQGMRAFLVLFLIDHFALDDAGASLIFGSYAALVLATSVLGGICADRWLGAKRAMLFGALLIMAGHLTLATDTFLTGWGFDLDYFQLFCVGLALIAVGTGLLKPNVLTAIGRLYQTGDPKRETGYYIYYIGVNVGTFLAPIVCGGLAARYGWAWGFGATAVGMALGVTSFVLGRRFVTAADPADEPRVPRRVPPLLFAGIIAAVGISAILVQHGFALGVMLALTMAGGLILFHVRGRRSGDPGHRAALLRLLALLPVPIFFELLFEQLSTSVTLFADRAVSHHVMGFAVSAPQLISLNGLFVLALLPFVASAWRMLAARGREPPPFAKFAIGFALIALAFVILLASTRLSPGPEPIGLGWMVASYLTLTLGELCIAPLTFALVGLVVPPAMAGLAMGLTLLSFAVGNFLSSLLAGIVSLPHDLPVVAMKAAYGGFFAWPALIAAAYAAVCLLLARVVAPAASDIDGAREVGIRHRPIEAA